LLGEERKGKKVTKGWKREKRVGRREEEEEANGHESRRD